jgi:hypothetical protein
MPKIQTSDEYGYVVSSATHRRKIPPARVITAIIAWNLFIMGNAPIASLAVGTPIKNIFVVIVRIFVRSQFLILS